MSFRPEAASIFTNARKATNEFSANRCEMRRIEHTPEQHTVPRRTAFSVSPKEHRIRSSYRHRRPARNVFHRDRRHRRTISCSHAERTCYWIPCDTIHAYSISFELDRLSNLFSFRRIRESERMSTVYLVHKDDMLTLTHHVSF